MNAYQIGLTISVVLGIIGFFGYTWEIFEYRVNRFTRWKDLTFRQWVLFIMAAQAPFYIAASLLAVHFFGA